MKSLFFSPMKTNNYDDNGLVTSYLIFTLIFPVTIYRLYLLFSQSILRKQCKCMNCRINKRRSQGHKLISLSLLVGICGYLVHNMLTIKTSSDVNVFDPWEILGIPENSTLKIIKKAHKKTMRMAKKNKKGEEVLKDINRAFSILNDPEEYSKWMLGGTDKNKSVIGIPKFLLRFGDYSIWIYFPLLGCVVYLCFLWYKKFASMTHTEISLRSTERFYENIAIFSENESVATHELLLFISRNEEFTKRKWKRTIGGEAMKVGHENEWKVPLVSKDENYLQICAYLLRSKKIDEEDACYIKDTLIRTIDSYVQIAEICCHTKVFEALILLRQMVVQTVIFPEFYMLQFPGIDIYKEAKKEISKENIKECIKDETMESSIKNPKESFKEDNSLNANKSNSGGFIRDTYTINSYKATNLEQMEVKLKETLSGNALKDALSLLYRIPRVEINDLRAFTLNTANDKPDNDEIKNPEEIVVKEGNNFAIEKNTMGRISFKITVKGGDNIVHSPFAKGQDILNCLIVYFKINNKLVSKSLKIIGAVKERYVEFPLENIGRNGEVQIVAANNSYIGVNCTRSLFIKLI